MTSLEGRKGVFGRLRHFFCHLWMTPYRPNILYKLERSIVHRIDDRTRTTGRLGPLSRSTRTAAQTSAQPKRCIAGTFMQWARSIFSGLQVDFGRKSGSKR